MEEYHCGCDWDPDFHRDLNIRRGKPEAGDRCTNTIWGGREEYMAQGGVCTPCVFGCPPEDDR